MGADDADRYDAVVIGAGQAGVPLAVALAKAGRRTAIIERAHVGGTCVNEGCTPTKTMVASARTAYVARRAHEYGVGTGDVSVDLNAVVDRKQTVVDAFRSGGERRLAAAGVELIREDGSFVGPNVLRVGSRTISMALSVIDVGARPSRPDIPGLADVGTLDSTSIMELRTLPRHLIVLGGGYVGVEFAQMFRRFGSQVTIIHRGKQLLRDEDPDVTDALAAILRDEGVAITLVATIVRIEARAGNAIAATVRTAGGNETIVGSHLLVATGRTPNTETLGLDAAGVARTAGGYIRVNDRLETTAPGIYATGDVNGEPAFTHISYDDYRILQSNLLHGGSASRAGRLVPYVAFTDPQLGRIGLTETEARASGRAVGIARLPMSAVARAIETGETRGMIKVVVDAATRRILGAAVLGIEGGEIMGALEIAMMGDVPYPRLRDGIFAHPTLMESLNNLFSAVETG